MPHEAPLESEELVFKCTTIGKGGGPNEPHMPGGALVFADSAKPEFPELLWAMVQEDRAAFYERVVRPHVVEKGLSAKCQARPSIGKTHMLKRMAVDLQAASHIIQMVARCHGAVRYLGETAMTNHAFCHKHAHHGTFNGWGVLG